MGRPLPSPSLAWRTVGQLGVIGRVDRAARRLGLERVEGRALRRAVWSGAFEGREVRLRACKEGGTALGLRVDLAAALTVPGFHLQRTPAGLSVDGHRGVAACVDEALTDALGPGDAIGLCASGARFSSSRRGSAGQLGAWLARLGRLLDQVESRPLPALLLTRATEAPRGPTRADAAASLFADYPGTPEAARAFERARTDPDGSVRLAAVQVLDPDSATAAYLALVRAETVPIEVRARAVEGLGSLAGEHPPALEASSELVGAPETALRAAAARSAGGLGSRGLPLLAAAVHDASAEVRSAAARALGAIGGGEAERLLLELLDPATPSDGFRHRSELEVKRTASAMLGRVGSVDAIGALCRYSEGAGLHAPLADAALAAIEQIRSRIPPGARGSLSVVSAEGQLSKPV